MRPAIALAMLVLLPACAADRCPAGHASIKRVPIVYGMPDTIEAVRGADERFEMIWAGCDSRPGSPTQGVICTTCRYRLGEHGVWSRFTESPAAFGLPLSDLIRNLPAQAPGATTTHPTYSQHIRDEARHEEFSFNTTEPLDVLEPRIRAYFRDSGVRVVAVSPPLDLRGVAIDAVWRGYAVHSEIIDAPGGRERSVRLELTRGTLWPSDN